LRILVVNAGSSSLKLRVLEDDDSIVASRDLSAPRAAIDEAKLGEALAGLGPADAVGHRIVHGGERFHGPVRLEDGVVAELEALSELAPLHQPKSLGAAAAVQRVLGDVPAVGCFDTAFHATLPPAAATYPLPAAWRDRWPLRRYGFHGLSHAYAARRASELLRTPLEELRIVSCHLGAGASLAAVAGGRSVDTTMGFTPLEGLAMATRSGSVDPGLLLWLLEQADVDEHHLADSLEHESGLVGLAGTPDMAEVVKRAQADQPDARLAFDVYVHRLRAGIAAMSAAMDGLECLVFTGGVGENEPVVRAAAAHGLGFLRVRVDPARNTANTDAEIGPPNEVVRTLVVTAREDVEIARQVRELLG
jgi:acetate kinase